MKQTIKRLLAPPKHPAVNSPAAPPPPAPVPPRRPPPPPPPGTPSASDNVSHVNCQLISSLLLHYSSILAFFGFVLAL